MKNQIILALTSFLTLSASWAGDSTDWPQWRGPARDGRISVNPATDWSSEPHLVWKVGIGQGHSTPVTQSDRVFALSRLEDLEVVTCLDLQDGKKLWEKRYPAPYKMNSAAYAHGKGPKSTPLVHQGRLYTLGIGGILSCFDLQAGTLYWRHDFEGVFNHTSPLYGSAMSPLGVDEMVIAHVGGENDGALRAFHAATGRLIWSWNGDGPGYASPILAEFEGVRQVVTQSQDKIVGVDLSNGRLLWDLPFETPWQQNVVTPVIHRDLLILSGLQKGTFAIRVLKEGDTWSTREVWSSQDVSMYMSSPVLAGELLFGLSHFKKGQFFCLNPTNGKVLWQGEGRQGDYAGLLLSEDFLFALNTDADLMVLEKSGKAFRKLAEHTVADSPTWAHPVILGSQLLIKDYSSLALWEF